MSPTRSFMATGSFRWLAGMSLLTLLCAVLQGCKDPTASIGKVTNNSPWKGTEKLRVLTSIVPIYCLTAAVAGGDADVLCLMTAHGPHDYQPSTEDVKVLSDADVFVVVGLGLEEFLDGMVRNSDNKKLRVVHAGRAVPKAKRIEAEGKPHYHGDKLVTHKGADPHVWLGIEEACFMVDEIRDVLVERDPEHAQGYKDRAAETVARLKKIQELRTKNPNKLSGGLVTFHDSFRYFGRSFQIDIVDTIRDVRGEQDSSPAALREQADEFQKMNVRVIGVEPQYPRGVAESLAKEIDALNEAKKAGVPRVKLVELDPLETGYALPSDPYRVDQNYYFQKLEQNLTNLLKAFE